MFCQYCGMGDRSGAKFYPDCGHLLNVSTDAPQSSCSPEPQPVYQHPHLPQKKKHKRPLLLVGMVTLLFAALWLAGCEESEAPDSENSSAPSQLQSDDAPNPQGGESEETAPPATENPGNAQSPLAGLALPPVIEGSPGDAQNPQGGGGEETTPFITENPGDYLPFLFESTDIYGNAVTEKSLGEKELFFIHFWGTWCPPCVAEMPDLASLALQYDTRVGFLGLLDDFDNTDGAKRILESAGVPSSFIMIDAYISEVAELLSMCSSGYVPTTVILDSSGNMIVEQLVGAYGEAYADILDLLLD